MKKKSQTSKKPRKQQDRSVETKNKILASAFDLFTNKIYSDVKVDEIAENAGVSKGAIFHHYPNGKKELIFDVIQQFMNTMGYDLANKAEKIFNNPKLAIQTLIDGTISYFIKFPKTIYLFTQMIDLELMTSHSVSDTYNFDLGKLYDSYIFILKDLFEKMNIKNPRGTALVLASSLDGLMIQLHYFDVNSMSDKFVKDFREGIYSILGFSEIPKILDYDEMENILPK
ncbi:MAG: HTH-type transcriptional regulator SrpR [Candidatus Heimdallarchaeota archaeon LC_3]|nr:MAG: HTH-type transcriptional regulator SrpR [Candidatus Heimdallarchaeota archaeon LC_3]